MLPNLYTWCQYVPNTIFKEIFLQAEFIRSNDHLSSIGFEAWVEKLPHITDLTLSFNPSSAAWHLCKPTQVSNKDRESLGLSLVFACFCLKPQVLFSLDAGYLGFSIHLTRPGDVIVLLPGTSQPALLRASCNDGEFMLVGFVWIFGIMVDNPWNSDKLERIKIIIV